MRQAKQISDMFMYICRFIQILIVTLNLENLFPVSRVGKFQFSHLLIHFSLLTCEYVKPSFSILIL